MSTLVLDNGSKYIKAGIAGEDAPKTVFTNVIGRLSTSKLNSDAELPNDTFIGEDAQNKRAILHLKYPIERGIVTNWDDMEKIWNYTFSKVEISSEGQSLLITQRPQTPKYNKEKIAEIMFEKCKVSDLHVTIPGLLSLYSSGRLSGIVLDSGDSVTHTVPIYEGFAVYDAILRQDLAGRDVTDYLLKLLNERGSFATVDASREFAREIKEKYSYVAQDFKKELELEAKNEIYELPDGQVVTLSSECYQCSEILFKPKILGSECLGLHKLINNSISKCSLDIRKFLYPNLIISGGNTLLNGMIDRLNKEILKLAPTNAKVKIIAPQERKYSVWIGGSVLATLPQFKQMCLNKKEYDESGANIVYSKFPL